MLKLILGAVIGLLWPLGFFAMAYCAIMAVREPRRVGMDWKAVNRVPTPRALKYWAGVLAALLAMLLLQQLPRLLGVNPN
jgi:hypothetical protein